MLIRANKDGNVGMVRSKSYVCSYAHEGNKILRYVLSYSTPVAISVVSDILQRT